MKLRGETSDLGKMSKYLIVIPKFYLLSLIYVHEYMNKYLHKERML